MIRTPHATDGDRLFLLDPFEPAYLALHRSGELADRVAAVLRELDDCGACPRHCHVDRLAGETGVCRTGRYARVASTGPHHGEERCLSGWHGSGTIFFALCNLRCVFCQNADISQQAAGMELPPDRIAALMLDLQRRGCHNINLVTPEHVVPQVLEAVAEAVAGGLNLPIVYNTSAYDSVESLRRLDGIVDIYMPDFKFWEPETARRLCGAQDYPERARAAVQEMHRQAGVLRFSPGGLARRGVLVRHLVMPGRSAEAEAIFRWLAEDLSPDTYLNVMAQYRPEYEVGRLSRDRAETKYTDINRRPTGAEITMAFEAARRAGLWRFDGHPAM